MVRLLARVIGVGVETADMLVQEILSRNLRDRRAVARYAGLTGSPDESGSKRREKGLCKAGNARVRRPTSPLTADSDEAAQAFRFDGARHSEMMPPRAWSLAG
jgi:transposase